MKPLNTLPVEKFLEKARIARKSNQRTLNLPIEDVMQLEESLSVIMTRMVGELDALALKAQQDGSVTVKMDGGNL